MRKLFKHRMTKESVRSFLSKEEIDGYQVLYLIYPEALTKPFQRRTSMDGTTVLLEKGYWVVYVPYTSDTVRLNAFSKYGTGEEVIV